MPPPGRRARLPRGVSAKLGRGRVYDCASESIGGYPFRLEWRCGGCRPRAQGHADAGSSSSRSFWLRVQVYDPTLVHRRVQRSAGHFRAGAAADLRGQLATRTGERARDAGRAGTRVARARRSDRSRYPRGRQRHGVPGATRRAAWSAGGRLDVRQSRGRRRPASHCRRRAEPSSRGDHQPIDADIAALLRGVRDVSPKPWPVRFKEWQERGGQARDHQGAPAAGGRDRGRLRHHQADRGAAISTAISR